MECSSLMAALLSCINNADHLSEQSRTHLHDLAQRMQKTFEHTKPSMNEVKEFACSLEFRRTLKIIARILREVVNRVKLGDQHARRGSRGEVV